MADDLVDDCGPSIFRVECQIFGRIYLSPHQLVIAIQGTGFVSAKIVILHVKWVSNIDSVVIRVDCDHALSDVLSDCKLADLLQTIEFGITFRRDTVDSLCQANCAIHIVACGAVDGSHVVEIRRGYRVYDAIPRMAEDEEIVALPVERGIVDAHVPRRLIEHLSEAHIWIPCRAICVIAFIGGLLPFVSMKEDPNPGAIDCILYTIERTIAGGEKNVLCMICHFFLCIQGERDRKAMA